MSTSFPRPARLPPIPREASARGGRARTAAKLTAADAARVALRDARELRRRGLAVPSGFRDAPEFLRTVAELSGQQFGGRAALARQCDVSTSTLSKWLAAPAKTVPTQGNLDKLIAWHRGLLGDEARVAVPGVATPVRAAVQGAPTVSLTRLSGAISARLSRTARLRNLPPLRLAEQILDRHLPRLEELER